MNKSLFTALFLLCSFIITHAQETTNSLATKRPVLFYVGEVKARNQITIPSSKVFTYLPIPGQEYLPAVFENKKGFVLASQVLPSYQEYESLTNSDVQLSLNQAGQKIQSGANTVLLGTAIALLGSGVGVLLAKKDPDLGYPIAAASSGLGFIITIGGFGSIANGGRKLKEYKTAK